MLDEVKRQGFDSLLIAPAQGRATARLAARIRHRKQSENNSRCARKTKAITAVARGRLGFVNFEFLLAFVLVAFLFILAFSIRKPSSNMTNFFTRKID